MNIIKTCYALALSFSFPIVIWEARENAIKLFIPVIYVKKEITFIVISLGFIMLCVFIGTMVSDLSIVFGFVGSTCTPLIAYIIPSLAYIKSGAANRYQDTILPKITLGIGLAIIPFGLTMWVLHLIS